MADQTADVFTAPISALPADIRQQQDDEMRSRMPGWRPVPGAADTNMLAAAAQVSAEGRAALLDKLADEIRELLGSIFGVPRSLGTPAFSTITVEAADTAGHELEAATTLFIGETELETVELLTIAASATTGAVAVQTVTAGSDANGLTGAVEIDTLDWLADDGVTLDAPLAGGNDPETNPEYDQRLRDEMRLLWPTPVTAENVAVYVRRNPAVGWAWAIKGYNADTGLSNQARTVTAVVAAADGAALLETVEDAIRDDILLRRETNWNVFIVGPITTSVDADAEVVVDPDHDEATVLAAVETVLRSTLAPGGWMRPRPWEVTDPNHQPARVIHKNTLIAEAAQVPGVVYVNDLTIGDGSSDHITLSSPRHLPTPGTITVTAA